MPLHNGTAVQWTSHTGKRRTGRYVFDFQAKEGFCLVVGHWDNKAHIMLKGKLNPLKEKSSGKHKETRS
jgi:hypothetical protein